MHTWKNSMVLHNRYHSRGWLSWPLSRLRRGNSNVKIIGDQLKLVEKMYTFHLDPTLLNLKVISFTYIRLKMSTWLAQNYPKKKMNSGQTICCCPLFQTMRFEHELDDVSSTLTTEKLWFLIWNLVTIKFNLLISFNCICNFISTFNFMQFYPCQTQLSSLKFNAFSNLVIDY